jgi:hypothetical protein
MLKKGIAAFTALALFAGSAVYAPITANAEDGIFLCQNFENESVGYAISPDAAGKASWSNNPLGGETAATWTRNLSDTTSFAIIGGDDVNNGKFARMDGNSGGLFFHRPVSAPKEGKAAFSGRFKTPPSSQGHTGQIYFVNGTAASSNNSLRLIVGATSISANNGGSVLSRAAEAETWYYAGVIIDLDNGMFELYSCETGAELFTPENSHGAAASAGNLTINQITSVQALYMKVSAANPFDFDDLFYSALSEESDEEDEDAKQGIEAESPEYYKEGGDGEFTRIYNLEPGKIKTHIDFRNYTGGEQNVTLISAVMKEKRLLSVNFSNDTVEGGPDITRHLAVDVNVPDADCTVETFMFESVDTMVPLMERHTFERKDTVIVPDPGNGLRKLSDKITVSAGGYAIPVRGEKAEGLFGATDGNVARDSIDRYFLVAKLCMDEIPDTVIRIDGINGTQFATGLTVSPKKLDFPKNVSANFCEITVDGPQNLVIRNWAANPGTGKEDIIILITPVETDVPYKYGGSVSHYFAPGVNLCPNGKIYLPTDKTVYFDKGVHPNVGKIVLKAGMKLYLAPGATVEGMVLVRGVGANPNGIKIYGRGILETRSSTANPAGGSQRGIFFSDTNNITVEGIGARSAYEMQTVYTKCSGGNIRYTNLMGVVLNNDGIDLDGTDNFLIENNFIMSGDDAFGWHGVDYVQTKDEAHPFGRPIRDIYARNNVIYNVRGGNAVRIGSSLEADEFRGVVIEDTYVVMLETGMGIHIDVQDWAAVSDVTFRNFFVEEMRYGYPTASGEFTVGYDYETRGTVRVEVLRGQYSRDVEQGGRRGMPEGLPSPRGSVRDVSIINFESPWMGTTLRPVAIGGYSGEHTVSGLTLRNVRIHTGSKVYENGTLLTAEQVRFLPSTDNGGEYCITAGAF